MSVCVSLMKAMSITSALMCHVVAKQNTFTLLTRPIDMMFRSMPHARATQHTG